MRKILLTFALGILAAAPAAAAQRSGQDPTKLPLAGGTLTGPLSIVSTSGNLPLRVKSPLGNGNGSLVVIESTNVITDAGIMAVILSTGPDPLNDGSGHTALGYFGASGAAIFSNLVGGQNISLLDTGATSIQSKKNQGITVTSQGRIDETSTDVFAATSSSDVNINSGGGAKIVMDGSQPVITTVGNVQVGLNITNTTCPSATSCTLTCAAGTFVVTGGCSSGNNINQSYPSAIDTWNCHINGTAVSITVYALCSRLSP